MFIKKFKLLNKLVKMNSFNTKITQTNKDNKLTDNAFNILIHSPFYIGTLALEMNGINYIDISRLTIRTLIYSQTVLSGVNLATSFTKYEKEIEITEPRQLYKNIALSILPSLTTFVSAHYLINSSILTLSMLNISSLGIIFSQLMHLYFTKKLGNNSNILYISFLLNLLFGLIFYIYLYKKIKAGINPFKRINDEYRMEDLKDVFYLKDEDMKHLNEENSFFFENLSEEEFEQIAEIFNREN